MPAVMATGSDNADYLANIRSGSTPYVQPQAPQFEPLGSQATMGAKAQVRAALDVYGLGSLIDQLYPLYLQGYDLPYIVEIARGTPEYAAAYPEMAERRKNNRTPLSESDVLSIRRSYDQILSASGLNGLFDRNIYARWIGGDVSPGEVQERVRLARQAAMDEPLEVRQWLAQNLGEMAGPAAIAYYLDPKTSLPELQKRLAAGEIGGAASRTGFGLLTATEARRLADLDVTGEEAARGFAELGERRELFGALPGSGEEDIGRSTQLAATFEGDAEAQRTIQNRAQRRAAQFGGGGSYARTREGAGGLGVAR